MVMVMIMPRVVTLTTTTAMRRVATRTTITMR